MLGLQPANMEPIFDPCIEGKNAQNDGFIFFGPKSLWMFLFKKDVIPKNHSSDPSATDIQQCSNYWSFRPLDQWPDYQTMCPGWNHQACGSTTVLITLQMKCARSTVSGNLFQCLAYLFVRANNLAGGFN